MRKTFFAAAALASIAGMASIVEEPVSRTKWVCPDEPFREGMDKDRFYRTEFDVRPGLTNAAAFWWFDDKGALFADGKEISRNNRSLPNPGDLTAALQRPGRHVIAIRNRNLSGVGGVCFVLVLSYADGPVERVRTTDAWHCATSAQEGWVTPGFDDSAWPQAKIHGDALVEPWCALADMTAFLDPDEKRTFEVFRAARAAAGEAAMKALDGEIKPQCRVVYEKGRARFDIGGRMFEPTFYNTSQSWRDTNRKLRRQTAYFRDADVHLYGLGINTPDAWKADGSVDFSAAEQAMKSALSIDPEARFFFSINTVLPPRWWVDRHPDELVGYQKADVNPDEKQCLKNCAAASAASRVWRKDIADFERRVVEHLEASPFAKRIFAYRTDWGINHEWHYYGMRGYLPDCGKAMTAAISSECRKPPRGGISKTTRFSTRRTSTSSVLRRCTAGIPASRGACSTRGVCWRDYGAAAR